MVKPPTIRSLAVLAGVSKATVSLALRDSPRISLSERQRIQRLATEAGYERNALMAHLLTQLRSGKSPTYQSTLGLIYAARPPSDLNDIPTFRDWFAACQARARQLGYGWDEFVVPASGLNAQRLVKVLDARNIRGLVVVGPFQQSVIPPELDPIWERSATVVIGMRPVSPLLSCAANDQFSTAKKAVSALLDLGYTRPGLCINLEVDSHVEDRFEGGFGVAQKGLARQDRLPVFPYRPLEKDRFLRWVERFRPDAVVTLHPEIKDWLEAASLRVPADIGLVHLDCVPDLAGWAGTEQNNAGIGYAAIDMVIGQLHRNEIGIPPFQKCTFTNSTWIDGATVRRVGPPRAALKKPEPLPSVCTELAE